MANLRDLLMTEKLQEIAGLMQDVSGGNPGRFLAQTDMLRGAREGTPDTRLQALDSTSDQALADRYGWGADIASQHSVAGPLALIPPMAYEGVKAVSPGLLAAIGKLLPQGEEMQVTKATSPASLGNIRALLAGYLSAQ